jgi:hypothetical protein
MEKFKIKCILAVLTSLFALCYTSCSSDDDSGLNLSEMTTEEIADLFVGQWDISGQWYDEGERGQWSAVFTFNNNGSVHRYIIDDGDGGKDYAETSQYRIINRDGKNYIRIGTGVFSNFSKDYDDYEILTLSETAFNVVAKDDEWEDRMKGHKK